VLMAEGSPLQVMVALLVSGWGHVLHSVFKPWRVGGLGLDGRNAYVLQHFGLFVVFFVFLMGYCSRWRALGWVRRYDFLAWMMVVLCVAILVVAG